MSSLPLGRAQRDGMAGDLQLLLEHKIGCLPVLHHDRTLVGIVTVTDLLRTYVAVQNPGMATPE